MKRREELTAASSSDLRVLVRCMPSHVEQLVRLRTPASKEHVRNTVSPTAGGFDEFELDQVSQRFLDDLGVTELKLVTPFLLVHVMSAGCGGEAR